MVSSGTSCWRNYLPRLNGNQRYYLQRPPFLKFACRYSQHLRSACTGLQRLDRLGNIYVCFIFRYGFFETKFSVARFTKEMKNESAGLLAALFIGIAPGYISRSVAGSYDNEAIAIFLLMFTFYLWIKALKQGSAFFGTLSALFYFYMVAAWGKIHCFSCSTNHLIVS